MIMGPIWALSPALFSLIFVHPDVSFLLPMQLTSGPLKFIGLDGEKTEIQPVGFKMWPIRTSEDSYLVREPHQVKLLFSLSR